MRTRRKVSKFKADNPERFNTLMNKVIADLNELGKQIGVNEK